VKTRLDIITVIWLTACLLFFGVGAAMGQDRPRAGQIYPCGNGWCTYTYTPEPIPDGAIATLLGIIVVAPISLAADIGTLFIFHDAIWDTADEAVFWRDQP
jgi:hypothetical protein|tara:strand:+ start:119 stop:421 length:303 start_codon:yes stop_codon:yes gene_type:complete